MTIPASAPILTCAETKAWEERLFAGDEIAEWAAMQAAARAVAIAVLDDYEEIGGFSATGCVLVLVGKGHNGGDALLAAGEIRRRRPAVRIDVWLVHGVGQLRPLAARAWRQLLHDGGDHVQEVSLRSLANGYDLSLDGLFGFQFHPPLDQRSAEALRRANALPVRMRAAVDLPSGLDAADAFQADFTYATGAVKAPLLGLANAGRLRYLDLGFFADEAKNDTADRVLTAAVLEPLRLWRDPRADKRRHGHVLILAGSRNYPGAALMCVQAALRSGAGLVTAFVPESLVPAFAAQLPEAIWVAWPETPEGGLALEGRHLLQARLSRADALVIGPGLGREPETLALAADCAKTAGVPVLIDADALQPEVIAAARSPLVLTPHAGEFQRIAGEQGLKGYAATAKATVVLKGPVTRICAGGTVYHSFFGGPVLARGGSGDLLAGIVGAQLARSPDDVLGGACRGVAWHGRAADQLARAQGQVAVRTTQVLDFLGAALRL